MSAVVDPVFAVPKILLVEDAATTQLIVRTMLEHVGYEVAMRSNGGEALDLAIGWNPDLVVLDLGLPDIDGMDVCERLRKFTSAYIVMLTARDDSESRFNGLTAGADAYITKPFVARDLLVPIEVLLRRPRLDLADDRQLSFGDVFIDPQSLRVSVGDINVRLTKIEMALLQLLTTTPDRAHSRAALIAHIWGPHWEGGDHGISVHIANLRKKLEPVSGMTITTVRGVGYVLSIAEA